MLGVTAGIICDAVGMRANPSESAGSLIVVYSAVAPRGRRG
jgi:hypothetical protein